MKLSEIGSDYLGELNIDGRVLLKGILMKLDAGNCIHLA
jgi:hypothetical protein